MLPRDLLILIDKAEKKPLSFPEHLVVQHPTDPERRETLRIFTEVRKMDTGDYAIAGFEKHRLIERKGGAREAIQNCLTGDKDRWIRCLDRLSAACTLPLILMEGAPSDLLAPGAWCKDPQAALDSLMRMADIRRVTLEIIPCGTIHQRKVAGEWAARRLVNGAIACLHQSPTIPSAFLPEPAPPSPSKAGQPTS